MGLRFYASKIFVLGVKYRFQRVNFDFTCVWNSNSDVWISIWPFTYPDKIQIILRVIFDLTFEKLCGKFKFQRVFFDITS